MATKDYSVYGEHAAMIAEMDADAEEDAQAAAAAAPSPDLTFRKKTCAQCGAALIRQESITFATKIAPVRAPRAPRTTNIN